MASVGESDVGYETPNRGGCLRALIAAPALAVLAPAAALYADPLHPYTRALLASTPSLTPGAAAPPSLDGEPPSQTRPPSGCAFHPRCPEVRPDCAREIPALRVRGPGHRVACHLAQGDAGRSAE